MLQFDIITIFPKSFAPVIDESILKRAQEKKKIRVKVHDLRAFTQDKHRSVDDRPFGGGPGMVLLPQPIFSAVRTVQKKRHSCVILLCPVGKKLTTKVAKGLSRFEQLVIICGRYEGVDERVREKLVDESISIGDYVLTGGELPAMVLVDCVSRFIPGVLGKGESLTDESFEHDLLEYPQYTRPADFRGMKVPNVLLSGNHQAIEKWRREESIKRTRKLRPDLMKDKKKR